MRILLRIVETIAALVVMFYEWGWTSLSAAFDWLARLRAWAWVERKIARLPPYAALAVFALPSVLLFPVKLGALWLMANGYKLMGLGAIVAAKIVGTAVVARLFSLTRPALLQLAWFAWFYRTFKSWKDAWMARIRASAPWRVMRRLRARLRERFRVAWQRIRQSGFWTTKK